MGVILPPQQAACCLAVSSGLGAFAGGAWPWPYQHCIGGARKRAGDGAQLSGGTDDEGRDERGKVIIIAGSSAVDGGADTAVAWARAPT